MLQPDPDIAGIILAGGRATRMGGLDKALLTLAGESLLDRLRARLGPQVGALALNANGDPDRFGAVGLPILPDTLPGQPGPLAGVLAGMEWAARQGISRIVTVAADTPFVPLDLVARLSAAGDFAIAAGETDSGLRLHPVVGLWPVRLRGVLHRDLQAGLRRVMAWTEAHGARSVPWDARARDPFLNINTPADLDLARSLADQTGRL